MGKILLTHKKTKKSWLRNDLTRNCKLTQKAIFEEIDIGVEEHFESKQKHKIVVDKDLRDFKNGMGLNLSNFDELENFSTTFALDISSREFSFSTNQNDMVFYFAQLHKIIWIGQETEEYQFFGNWYDDLKFEETKAFLMSSFQKNQTKILIREFKKLFKYDPFVKENPLHAFMYKVDEYKRRFLYKKFISFKYKYSYRLSNNEFKKTKMEKNPFFERMKIIKQQELELKQWKLEQQMKQVQLSEDSENSDHDGLDLPDDLDLC